MAMLVMSVWGALAATPRELLAGAAEKLSKAASVSATFTMRTDNGQVRGSMQMAGRSFALTAGELSMWYDGKTQWVYSVTSGEVNVSVPDADELVESNPFMLLSGYQTRFNIASGGADTAVLTPKNKAVSDISKAVIMFGKNGWPHKITVTFGSGASAVVTIGSITMGKTLPAATFRFDPRKYPEAEIIDLR